VVENLKETLIEIDGSISRLLYVCDIGEMTYLS
jgi:hypothetical protein